MDGSRAPRTATRAALCVGALTCAAGCKAVESDALKERAAAEFEGLLAGHLALDAWDEEGPLAEIGLLGSARAGEAASFDLGPWIGVGAGASGARLKLLGVELALGTGLVPPELRDAAPAASDDEGESADE